MPQSIQEWLTGIGFQEWRYSEVFERAGVKIPYEELAGHTVASFKEKAKRKGWITEAEASGVKTAGGVTPAVAFAQEPERLLYKEPPDGVWLTGRDQWGHASSVYITGAREQLGHLCSCGRFGEQEHLHISIGYKVKPTLCNCPAAGGEEHLHVRTENINPQALQAFVDAWMPQLAVDQSLPRRSMELQGKSTVRVINIGGE